MSSALLEAKASKAIERSNSFHDRSQGSTSEDDEGECEAGEVCGWCGVGRKSSPTTSSLPFDEVPGPKSPSVVSEDTQRKEAPMIGKQQSNSEPSFPNSVAENIEPLTKVREQTRATCHIP